MKSRWHHIPIFHTHGRLEKKANWLELFYDLIYVAAFIQLGNAFSAKVALIPLLQVAGLFIPLWLTWTGYTYYSNRYTIDDLLHRIMIFFHMFAIGAMAISIPMVLQGQPFLFGAAYAIAQFIMALLYLRAYLQQPQGQKYTQYWGWVFFLSALIWAFSLIFNRFIYWGWAIGALVILIAPILSYARVLAEEYPFDHEHLSERYGLLTIIVLGESFVKVLSELSGTASGLVEIVQASFALLITCCLWWIYFDDVAGTKLKSTRFSMVFWLFSHIPLQLAIILLGVGIKKTAGYDFYEVLPLNYAWLLAGALGLAFFSTAIIDSVTLRQHIELSDASRVFVRWFSGCLIVLLAAVSQNFLTGWFMAACILICIFQIFFDIVSSPEHFNEKELEQVAVKMAQQVHGEQKKPELSVFDVEPLRKGVPSGLKKDLYFYFLEASWSQLFLNLFFLYLLSNILFATLYLLQPESIANAKPSSFADAFFFSVQTMTTIGYGALAPQGYYANLLVTCEAAFGLIGVAIITGLVFAKLSRPNAKILFSHNLLLHKIHGQPHLVFRMGNARGNDIVEAKVSLAALIDEFSQEGQHMRRIYDLALVRDQTPFFKLSWTVMHPLTPESPLYGMDLKTSALQGIIVTVSGHDSIFSTTIYTRHTYTPDLIREDVYFEDIMNTLPDGRMMIDYGKFHDLKP